MCRINMANGSRGTMRTMNNQKTVMRILGGKTSRGDLSGDVMTWKDGSTWTRVSAERSRSAPASSRALNGPQAKSEYKKNKPKLDWDNVLETNTASRQPEAGTRYGGDRGETTQDTYNSKIIKV